MLPLLINTDETDPIKVWELVRESIPLEELKRKTRDYTFEVWATTISTKLIYTSFWFTFFVRLDIDPTNRKPMKATLEVHHLGKIVGIIS